MTRYASFLAMLGAVAPAMSLAATTTSASNILNLFVLEPDFPAGVTPTVRASIVEVGADPTITSLSTTIYYVHCDVSGTEYNGKPKPGACNYLDGASVTVNPTGMTLNLRRGSDVLSVDRPYTDSTDAVESTRTVVSVRAQATCKISIDNEQKPTFASCTGDMTSRATTYAHADSTSIVSSKSTVELLTYSSLLSGAEVRGHYLSATITAGLEKLPTSTTSVTTRSSSGAAARMTGMGHAAVVAGGAAVLAVGGAVGGAVGLV